MKILLSADMEGVSGVTSWDQVTPGHPEYSRFRRIMTADVNAAVRGAFDGGADEVVIADGHWNGSNILIEEIDPRAKLNSGSPSPFSMMQGIDQGVNGVIFLGYHARQGSRMAVLDHTWSDTCVANVWLNEMLAGEYTINAALAGYYGVPILMATGDQIACLQMKEQLGGIETVIVKQGTGRYAAECLSPEITHPMIEACAKRSIQKLKKDDSPLLFKVQEPIKFSVELQSSYMADKAMLLPGVTREDRKISFTAEDMPKAYWVFRALVQISYPR